MAFYSSNFMKGQEAYPEISAAAAMICYFQSGALPKTGVPDREREELLAAVLQTIYLLLGAEAAFDSFMHLSRSNSGSHLRTLLTLAIPADYRLTQRLRLWKWRIVANW